MFRHGFNVDVTEGPEAETAQNRTKADAFNDDSSLVRKDRFPKLLPSDMLHVGAPISIQEPIEGHNLRWNPFSQAEGKGGFARAVYAINSD